MRIPILALSTLMALASLAGYVQEVVQADPPPEVGAPQISFDFNWSAPSDVQRSALLLQLRTQGTNTCQIEFVHHGIFSPGEPIPWYGTNDPFFRREAGGESAVLFYGPSAHVLNRSTANVTLTGGTHNVQGVVPIGSNQEFEWLGVGIGHRWPSSDERSNQTPFSLKVNCSEPPQGRALVGHNLTAFSSYSMTGGAGYTLAWPAIEPETTFNLQDHWETQTDIAYNLLRVFTLQGGQAAVNLGWLGISTPESSEDYPVNGGERIKYASVAGPGIYSVDLDRLSLGPNATLFGLLIGFDQEHEF